MTRPARPASPARAHAALLGLLLAAALAAPLDASAQTAPSPAEAAAYTGLHAAAHRGDAAAVTRLAATDRRGLEARDGNGRTPLHVATFAAKPDAIRALVAAHLGHDGMVRRLIAAGAPLDHINSLHWTALIEAIVLGDGGPRHEACVRALVEAGADTRIGDRQGVMPAELANSLGYVSMVRLIGQAPARPQGAPVPR